MIWLFLVASAPTWNVTLNGDAAKNYSINLTSEDGTAFEIVDAGGTKIGEGTVSGGSLVDGEASMPCILHVDRIANRIIELYATTCKYLAILNTVREVIAKCIC